MPTPTVVRHSSFIYPGALTPPATTSTSLVRVDQGNTIVLCYFGGATENVHYSNITVPNNNVTWNANVGYSYSTVGVAGLFIGTVTQTDTSEMFELRLNNSAPTIMVFELLGGFTLDNNVAGGLNNTGYTALTMFGGIATINELVFGVINPNATTVNGNNYANVQYSTGGAVYGVQWGPPGSTAPQTIAWNQTPTNDAIIAGVALDPVITTETTGGSSSSTTSTSIVIPQISIALVGSDTDASTAFAYSSSREAFYTTGNGTSNSTDFAIPTIELQIAGTSNSVSDAENPIPAQFLRTPYGSSTSTSDVEDALLSSEVIGSAISVSTTHVGLDEVVERDNVSGSSTSVSTISGVTQNQGTAPLAGGSRSISTSQLVGIAEADRVTLLGASIGTSAASGAPQSIYAVSGATAVAVSTDTGAESKSLTEPETASSLSVSLVGTTSMSLRASVSTQAAVAISSAIGVETKSVLVLVQGSFISQSSAQGSESFLAHFLTAGSSISFTSDVDSKPVTESAVIVAAHSTSLSATGAGETSIINYVVSSVDVGTSIENEPVDTVRAALLSHLNDFYVVPDVKLWEIENERARRAQAFYRMGEYGIFVLLWNYQDFEANLVGRCQTCFVTEGNLENTWKQPGYFKCPDCLGTTFEGGYKALLVRPSLWTWEEPTIRQDRKGVINTDTGTVQTTGDFRMQPKDYIIRGDGSRWQVSTVQADHLDTGFGTQAGPWNAVSFTYPNVARENESSPIYLLPITEATIQEQITQYYSRQPIS